MPGVPTLVSGVPSYLAQVALGPLVKLWPVAFDPRGVTYSPLCFWTRAAAPGIHLVASKPSIRVQIGQRGPISL